MRPTPRTVYGRDPQGSSHGPTAARYLFAAVGCLAPLLMVQASSGAGAPSPAVPLVAARQFEAQIVPLLARHCLACHGPGSKQGGLDLSQQKSALSGGAHGKAIVPGKSAESLVWKHVASGAMPPKDRPRLSPQEKRALREWIDAGAVWSGDAIDPLAHTRERRAAHPWLRRLTVPEYVETVRSATGVDVAEDARRILPPDVRADGFTNTAYNLTADLAHVEGYARLAEIIVGRLDVDRFAARFEKGRGLDDASMRRLIAGMGTWLLRGPLQSQEVDAFLRVSKAVTGEGGAFTEAVRYVVEAMLQSPRFLYRIEAEADQAGGGKSAGKLRTVGPYELASRLSYTLWGGPPDAELLRAAGAGELARRPRVEAQVRRMLQDPRAVRRSRQFISEWLNLDRLGNLRPNPSRFPSWSGQLAADMREETLAFFEEVAWKQKRPLAALMNAPVTFATPHLAAHYGLPLNLATRIRREGLQALYTFGEGQGDTLRDTSGAGDPLDLKIANPAAVRWERGSLVVTGPTVMAGAQPPKRLLAAVRQSKALSLEAWITPENTKQKGPARILTLSSGPHQRNFTLGQEGDRFEVRFRGNRTDPNGLPGVGSPDGTAATRLTHLVYTRDAAGKTRLYLNGEVRGAGETAGDLANWGEDFRLALGNETTGDRPWRGALHLVALYNRALTPEEIRSTVRQPARYDLTQVPGRGGLLTQGSVLTVGGDEASMVARGLFILRDLLYSEIGSAPPGVDTTPVPPKRGQSRRAVAETRVANPACGGCHARFEPLAFGLEKFDGVGAYHERDEHGNPLREDGKILFPETNQPAPYTTTSQLMDLLARNERVRKNITRKVVQFALGRPLVQADGPEIDRIHAAAQKGGGTYAALIAALVMSDLIQKTPTESQP